MHDYFAVGLDTGDVAGDLIGLPSYVSQAQRLFTQVLRLELPTVAATNGHAFGASATLALGHDHRVAARTAASGTCPSRS